MKKLFALLVLIFVLFGCSNYISPEKVTVPVNSVFQENQTTIDSGVFDEKIPDSTSDVVNRDNSDSAGPGQGFVDMMVQVLSSDKFVVNTNNDRARYMFESPYLLVRIPLTLENKAGFDLKYITVFGFNLKQNDWYASNHGIEFQTEENNKPKCYTIEETSLNSIDMRKDCKVSLNLMASIGKARKIGEVKEFEINAVLDKNKPVEINFLLSMNGNGNPYSAEKRLSVSVLPNNS